MIKTYVLDTTQLQDPLEDASCMELLSFSNERMEKTVRIRQPDARKQSFGAGLFLSYVLQKAGSGARLYFNSFGKPFVTGTPFNISHTKHYAILSIWEPQQPSDKDLPLLLGCDIEMVHAYRPNIARRFFMPQEHETLESISQEHMQAELFCRYWTRKESVMKLAGLGMALPMNLYDVRSGQAYADTGKTRAWILEKEHAGPEYRKAAEILLEGRLFFQEYWHDGCCITVCSTKKECRQEGYLIQIPRPGETDAACIRDALRGRCFLSKL